MNTSLNDCFAEHHQLMPAKEALAQLRESVQVVVTTERCDLANAKGRILARDLSSPRAIPAFNNAAVDGYAFNSNDLNLKVENTLNITQIIYAGDNTPAPMKMGEAARIFTGAPLPEGADTVIMQEDICAQGTPPSEGRVTLPAGIEGGCNWRPQGEDMQQGQLILRKGQRLKPQDIGGAAAMGFAEIDVYAPLKVALFSTGNEIQDPGSALKEGHIYDVNRYMLMSQLAQMGAEVSDLGILPDDFEGTCEALSQAAESHHAILSSGGVSTGDKDQVALAIKHLGRINFWRLAIKPGRPLAFGHINNTPLIGFPGNPVAAGVCFMRFGFPLLCAMAGQNWPEPVTLTLPSAFTLKKKAGRTEWLRAQLQHEDNGQVSVNRHPKQGSGILSSLIEADGLIEAPEDLVDIKPGDPLTFLPFSQFNLA
jgi:molybdopterin molybdotransferase